MRPVLAQRQYEEEDRLLRMVLAFLLIQLPEQIEHGGDEGLAVLELQLAHRHPALEHTGMVGALEVIMFKVAEIGEGDLDRLIMLAIEDVGKAQPGGISAPVAFLKVPLAFLAPTEPGRA